MNKLRRSMYLTGIVIVLGFLGLCGWFGVTVYTQGAGWSASQYNQRATSAKHSTVMGDIADRDGMLLATTTENGKRQYSDIELVRRAVSQTVGDQLSMSGTGVESYHADILTGSAGSLVDRASAALAGDTYSGDDIQLTIDATLSAYISKEFPDGYEGAVCMINYRTGEILAMVSKPDYDPQVLVDSRLYGTEGSYYFNRCLQGQYTPGSVFKIVTLASALDTLSGITERSFQCTASRPFANTTVTCLSGTLAHGGLSLQTAFTRSCNCTFASIACEVGADRLLATARAFAFDVNFSFDDITLYESTIADDMTDLGDLAWTGVGQGKTTVTPLHMAMIAGAIANNGLMMEPLLIGRVVSSGGLLRQQAIPTAYRQICSEATADTVLKYMYRAVTDGTAVKAAVNGYTVCGKTGSAETTENKSVETNAWFVGCMVGEDTPYAIAVVIEQGGSGGDKAAALASKAFAKAVSLVGAVS